MAASARDASLDKGRTEVAAMFDRVAERYDLANDVLSLGQDRAWRKLVLDAVDPQVGDRVLDLAAGTGTSSEPFAAAGAFVVPTDISLGMLTVGKRRSPWLSFVAGDGLQLPYADDSFDAVTISFGLRNVSDTVAALTELRRVTKPGGRLVVCEFSTPTWTPFRAALPQLPGGGHPTARPDRQLQPGRVRVPRRVDPRLARSGRPGHADAARRLAGRGLAEPVHRASWPCTAEPPDPEGASTRVDGSEPDGDRTHARGRPGGLDDARGEMAGRLAGRTALVTGATSNIGRSIAERFAAEGATVAVNGRNADRGAEVVDGIRADGGRAVFVHGDLDGTAAVSNDLAARAEEALGGRVDILVNNAALVHIAGTVDTDEAMLDASWAVNVKAPFFLVARLAPAMAARGGGAVINISSWMARTGTSMVVAYTATKSALDVLTKDWAAEFGPAGVRVNTIAPGVVREDPSRPDPGAASMVGTPYGRILTPLAIAHAAVYLASDEASAVHGISLDVDGGRGSVAIFGG